MHSLHSFFVSWQSDRFKRYGRFNIWSWKVKVKAKVKPDGHIWSLEFNFLFVSGQLEHFWLRSSKFHILPWKFKVKVKVSPDGYIWGLEFNQYVCFFVSWQSDHFWLRYCKLHVWTWKFKVKIMDKVNPNGHIWGLEMNWYICFLYHGNCIIFGWDLINSIFDQESSRSQQRNLVRYRKSIDQSHQSCQKWKNSEKLFGIYCMNKSLWPLVKSAYELAQKHKINQGPDSI